MYNKLIMLTLTNPIRIQLIMPTTTMAGLMIFVNLKKL